MEDVDRDKVLHVIKSAVYQAASDSRASDWKGEDTNVGSYWRLNSQPRDRCKVVVTLHRKANPSGKQWQIVADITLADMDDWYPFQATKKTIAGLEAAGITPAKCWAGDFGTGDQGWISGYAVAIWGRDISAFKKAVKLAHRAPRDVQRGPSNNMTFDALKAALC
jgi:hypothetical protein